VEAGLKMIGAVVIHPGHLHHHHLHRLGMMMLLGSRLPGRVMDLPVHTRQTGNGIFQLITAVPDSKITL